MVPSGRSERAEDRLDEAPRASEGRAGPYRLLDLVGRGGMGDVYRAVRDDDQFEKIVALKVVRPGALSPGRFRSERQILACLEHAGIARLLDGGTMADGRPYLVMELVEGVRLDAFVETHRLDVRARVELFRRICAAVQHAHQNLVVHRDLKPANILVTASGEPKLLDFGVAKLLEDTTPGDGLTTVASVMTPAYASPEQIRGEPVTTASDVYSLGAVLYELVAGVRPHHLTGAALRLAVCEQEPERPSVARRQAQPPTRRWRRRAGRAREVGADLDAIVMKALRKEPPLRYPTVEAFSEDLGRYLAGMPVAAAHGTRAYRARRFVARNRVAVTLAAAAVALAVAFVVNDQLKTRRLARERDRAERVTAFLVDLFRSDPEAMDGNAVTARQVLDRGADQIASSLSEEPELRARLLDTLGRAHRGLGLHARAAELYESSLASRRAAGGGNAELARTLVGLGEARYNQGDLAGAEKAYREGLALRRQAFGNHNLEVADTLILVAKALRSRTFQLEAVEALLAEAVAIQRGLAPNDLYRAPALTQLAHLKRDRGDYAGAEALLREGLAIRRRIQGTERPHAAVAGALGNLGVILRLKADDAAAEAVLREALAMKRALYGPEHPSLVGTQCHLGSLLRERGDFAAAEELLRQTVAMESRLARDHSALPQCLADLGTTLCDAGDCAAGEALHRQAIAVTREQLGARHPVLSNRLAELGDDLRAEGRLAEAEAALREALEICSEGLPADGPDRADILVGLADVLAARGDPQAVAAAREGFAIRRRLLPPDHPEVAEAESVLGASLAAAGQLQEAEPLLSRSHAALVARRGPRPRAARDAAARAADLYDRTGRADLARAIVRGEP